VCAREQRFRNYVRAPKAPVTPRGTPLSTCVVCGSAHVHATFAASPFCGDCYPAALSIVGARAGRGYKC
jgi:hypothetical protein